MLIIDDSAVARKAIEKLAKDFGYAFHSVASAAEADQYLAQRSVDLITLDLHMREVNGQKWLHDARRRGLRTPVVIISSAHPSEAQSVLSSLETGAQEYIEKTTMAEEPDYVRRIFNSLIQKCERVQTKTHLQTNNINIPFPRTDLILIGASTGGPYVLSSLLKNMPEDCPPVFVVQHISTNFAESFAQRLQKTSALKMGEVHDGAEVLPGHLYMALGDYHIGIKKDEGRMIVRTSTNSLINSHRPSVDFLFRSAVGLRFNVVAAILTGMGHDGARGIAELKSDGAFTIAQSEEDCVIFGMPNEAIRCGGISYVGTVPEIRKVLNLAISLRAIPPREELWRKKLG